MQKTHGHPYLCQFLEKQVVTFSHTFLGDVIGSGEHQLNGLEVEAVEQAFPVLQGAFPGDDLKQALRRVVLKVPVLEQRTQNGQHLVVFCFDMRKVHPLDVPGKSVQPGLKNKSVFLRAAESKLAT